MYETLKIIKNYFSEIKKGNKAETNRITTTQSKKYLNKIFFILLIIKKNKNIVPENKNNIKIFEISISKKLE